MKKKLLMGLILLNLTIILHSQSPLGNRGREWMEQDGYAIVNGVNYHYWLYSLEYYGDYHKWNKKIVGESFNDVLAILQTEMFRWVERQGWTIDYDNYWVSHPNNNLASSVKMLMASRSQNFGILNRNSKYMDVSVTIVVENSRRATLIINNWNFMKEDSYTTWGYPLVKF